MKNRSVGFLLGLVFLAPSLWAFTSASQDYDDQGMALYNQGLYSKSIEYFQNAVQADPTNWQAYEDMGNAYSKMNNTQAALDSYEKSLQINGNNTELQGIVKNMGGNPNPPQQVPPVNGNNAPPQASGPYSDQGTVVVQRGPRHRWREAEPEPAYKDNLAPIDHAKFWAKLELGYDYSLQGDLVNSANSINGGTYNPAAANVGATAYNGSALSSNSGIGWGGELGFLVNPNFGIGLGARYIQTNNYTASVQYNNVAQDAEDLTLSPSVVPITLDLFLFLPDHDGRFYISGGVGYYQGIVWVDQKTTSNNFFGTPTGPDEWTGNLYGENIGFQLGIGREFEVSRHFGVEIYARGYYAKLTNFTGTLYDNNGNGQPFALAASNSGPTIVDADEPQYVNGGNGERYANVDFTGFDVGISLNFYSF